MTEIDNGGAIAIKGFNYQKAAIIHVMIHNFKKENFKVIPESHDDFEVHLEQDTYFIQVKGTKNLSLKKLISKPKGDPSILEKNLSIGNDGDSRKIFLWDLSDTTKKELISQAGRLIPNKYSFSEKQSLEIINSLALNESEKERLKNQYIYVTPFSNDLKVALTMLKGEMVDENLLVTNDRAKVVLGELSLEIDQKSEITITNDSDLKRKEIDGEFLKKVFLTVKQKELFDEIVDNLSINTFLKNKIKKEKLRIPLLYEAVKEKLKKEVNFQAVFYESNSDDESINLLKDLIMDITPEIENTELILAIAIDCYIEWGEGI